MMHIKYCKKCRKAFDRATNFDKCPECRMGLNDKELNEVEEWKNKKEEKN